MCEDEPVETGHGGERRTDLITQELFIGGAEEVEFAVLIQQFREIFEETIGHHGFAVPIVDGLADRVGQLEDGVEFFPRFGDPGEVGMAVRRRVGGIVGEPVQSAEGAVAPGADLEAVDTVCRRLGDDALHVFRIQLRRMHQTPGDLRHFTHFPNVKKG